MTDRQDINIEALRKVLLDEKAELERICGISAESRDAVELDQTRVGRLSRMDAMLQQEMAKETNRRRQSDLQRIEVALKRMGDGDYGYCVQCDEEIASRRLEIDPSSLLCIGCASGLGKED